MLQRLRKLTPYGGWRQFATELVVVVLGILIALGAQQAVDAWNWRSEVAEFRDALDSELGFNLGAIEDRMKQSDCINRRLDQLDRWQRVLQDGGKVRLTSRIGRPTSLNVRTSVWESRTADVASHLGLDARLAYAALYDLLGGYRDTRQYERQVWNEMLDFEGTGELDRRDLLRLRGLVERGRLYSRLVDQNTRDFKRNADAIGIRAWIDPGMAARDNVCQPLTWQTA